MAPLRSIKKNSSHRQMQTELRRKLESVQEMEDGEEKQKMVKRLNEAIELPEDQLQKLPAEKLQEMEFEWDGSENPEDKPSDKANDDNPGEKPPNKESSSGAPSNEDPSASENLKDKPSETTNDDNRGEKPTPKESSSGISSNESPSADSSATGTSSQGQSSSGDPSSNSVDQPFYDKVFGNKDRKPKEVKIKEEAGNEDSMFVPNDNDANYADDIDDNFYQPQDVEATFAFPGAEKAHDGATVGYAFSDRFRKFINRYGMKSVARYRLEKYAQDPTYEDRPSLPPKHWVSNAENRLGEVKNAQNKYTYRHCKIIAVAWKPVGFGPSRQDLDLINPAEDPNYRTVPTYCLVKWENGQIRWETRATIRNRYGKEKADKGIFQAAVACEKRYEEAQRGTRVGQDRTPSVGFDKWGSTPPRSMSPEEKDELPEDGQSSPPPVTPVGKSKSSGLDKARDEWIAEYLSFLDLKGVDSFKDLPRSEKRECLAAWNEEKAARAQTVA
jgi:hypothetical protein